MSLPDATTVMQGGYAYRNAAFVEIDAKTAVNSLQSGYAFRNQPFLVVAVAAGAGGGVTAHRMMLII